MSNMGREAALMHKPGFRAKTSNIAPLPFVRRHCLAYVMTDVSLMESVTEAPLPLDYSLETEGEPTADEKPRPWVDLPLLARPPRSNRYERVMVGVLLAVILGVFAWMLVVGHTAANAGVDQNGYLTNGRMLLQGRLWYTLKNPWQFIGSMMVLTADGRVTSKYPLGLPAMYALARFLGGPLGVYWVDPAAMLLACGLAFFLFRKFVGDFLALLGVLVLIFNPITLTFADDANSHGAALFCTVTGFLLLATFWQKGGWWRGLLAGFFLGYSSTVRYTDFLWIIPVLFVLVVPLGERRLTWKQRFLCLAGFAVPVGLQAMANWACFGAPWRTGYALCDEQTGFAWKYLWGTTGKHGNWLTVLEQFDGYGLMIIFPLALAGLVRMFWDSWKAATFLALWAIPGAVLYMLYYWAPAGWQTVGYLRFFLNFCPALVIAATWFVARASHDRPRAMVITAALLTAVAVGVGARAGGRNYYHTLRSRRQFAVAEKRVRQHLPPGSVLFASDPMCEQLGSIGGYRLYNTMLFSPRAFWWIHNIAKKKGPSPFQHSRALKYLHMVGRKNTKGHWIAKPLMVLQNQEMDLMRAAFKAHKKVAMLVHLRELSLVRRVDHQMAFKQITSWSGGNWFNLHRLLQRPWFKNNPQARARFLMHINQQEHMNRWVLCAVTPNNSAQKKSRAKRPAAREFWSHFLKLPV